MSTHTHTHTAIEHSSTIQQQPAAGKTKIFLPTSRTTFAIIQSSGKLGEVIAKIVFLQPTTPPPLYKRQFKLPPDMLEEHDTGFGQKTKFPEEETNKQAALWDKAALVTRGSGSN